MTSSAAQRWPHSIATELAGHVERERAVVPDLLLIGKQKSWLKRGDEVATHDGAPDSALDWARAKLGSGSPTFLCLSAEAEVAAAQILPFMLLGPAWRVRSGETRMVSDGGLHHRSEQKILLTWTMEAWYVCHLPAPTRAYNKGGCRHEELSRWVDRSVAVHRARRLRRRSGPRHLEHDGRGVSG